MVLCDTAPRDSGNEERYRRGARSEGACVVQCTLLSPCGHGVPVPATVVRTLFDNPTVHGIDVDTTCMICTVQLCSEILALA